ncbi:DUF3052 family protein [Algoriphagus aestuarii]|nr:DUF3052 family protein [Algoriphagus aestuarii]
MESSGYSGTPLAKKLGIKEGFLVQVLFFPKPYSEFFSDLPSNFKLELHQPFSQEADLIHAFVLDEEELEISFVHASKHLKKNGAIWISWPKKTSGIQTRVDKYQIMNYGLSAGFVDVKVAAIDEQWSGLKFMIRKKDR